MAETLYNQLITTQSHAVSLYLLTTSLSYYFRAFFSYGSSHLLLHRLLLISSTARRASLSSLVNRLVLVASSEP